jgi:hypothetical protein
MIKSKTQGIWKQREYIQFLTEYEADAGNKTVLLLIYLVILKALDNINVMYHN